MTKNSARSKRNPSMIGQATPPMLFATCVLVWLAVLASALASTANSNTTREASSSEDRRPSVDGCKHMDGRSVGGPPHRNGQVQRQRQYDRGLPRTWHKGSTRSHRKVRRHRRAHFHKR